MIYNDMFSQLEIIEDGSGKYAMESSNDNVFFILGGYVHDLSMEKKMLRNWQNRN